MITYHIENFWNFTNCKFSGFFKFEICKIGHFPKLEIWLKMAQNWKFPKLVFFLIVQNGNF